jgi:hypothetical protein
MERSITACPKPSRNRGRKKRKQKQKAALCLPSLLEIDARKILEEYVHQVLADIIIQYARMPHPCSDQIKGGAFGCIRKNRMIDPWCYPPTQMMMLRRLDDKNSLSWMPLRFEGDEVEWKAFPDHDYFDCDCIDCEYRMHKREKAHSS